MTPERWINFCTQSSALPLHIAVAALLLPSRSDSLTVPLVGVRHAPVAHRQVMLNFKDVSYFGTVHVGDQELQGVFDTGSVELAVISDKCTEWCGSPAGLYHASRSASYRKGLLSVLLSYGSGQILGSEAYDTVEVGPLSSAFTPFWEVVDSQMPLLTKSHFQVIVGLGPIPPGTAVMEPGHDNSNAFALFLKRLSVQRFSVCLGRAPGADGYLTWHDDYLERMPSVFTKLHVVGSGFWMVNLKDVRLGNKMIACAGAPDYGQSPRSCGAVLDSGTSLLSMPSQHYRTFLQAIEELKTDCSDLSLLPDLHFVLDGQEHSLPPDAYLAHVHGTASRSVSQHLRVNATMQCQAALMQMNLKPSAGQTWILGMSFFREYYTIFAQATANAPAQIYTASATEHCQPEERPAQQRLAQQRKILRVRSARSINASEVRFPLWLQQYVSPAGGSLEPTPGQTPELRKVVAGQTAEMSQLVHSSSSSAEDW